MYTPYLVLISTLLCYAPPVIVDLSFRARGDLFIILVIMWGGCVGLVSSRTVLSWPRSPPCCCFFGGRAAAAAAGCCCCCCCVLFYAAGFRVSFRSSNAHGVRHVLVSGRRVTAVKRRVSCLYIASLLIFFRGTRTQPFPLPVQST